ncbi:hypothetical protein C8Q80DRAFT_1212581, partial [Daedaleopsis nitida]
MLPRFAAYVCTARACIIAILELRTLAVHDVSSQACQCCGPRSLFALLAFNSSGMLTALCRTQPRVSGCLVRHIDTSISRSQYGFLSRPRD